VPTLAGGALAPLLNAVVFNADAVRANLSQDLGFSHTDRTEHARRMGWLCDRVVEAGGTTIADFICPTEETRAAFGEAFTIWVTASPQAALKTPIGCSLLPRASIFGLVPKGHRNTGPSRH